MRSICLLCIVTFCLITGCHNDADKGDWNKYHRIDHYTPPTDHVLHAGDVWSDKACIATDSMTLWDAQYACDCPRWVLRSLVDRPIDDKDRNDQTYYIEPSGSYDPLDSLHSVGMTLMFYGHLDTAERYPKNATFIDGDPPLGKVFVYCGYRVIDAGHLAGGDVPNDDTIDLIP